VVSEELSLPVGAYQHQSEYKALGVSELNCLEVNVEKGEQVV
jgi:hypothetical protein